MIKLEYDLSLSNDSFKENRVDELDSFLKHYYNSQYEQINKIYKVINPIFGCLTFICVPILALALQKSFMLGAIVTALEIIGLLILMIYMEQKPKAIKKNIFTSIYEDHRYIVTDVEYKMLSLPVLYHNKKMFYYEFVKSFNNDYRLRISDDIKDAQLIENESSASYSDVVAYLNQKDPFKKERGLS